MAIQNRRGVYSDFTPTKMVPGEIAVVQSGDPNNSSGKAVYAAFGSSGDVKRLATEDDLSGKVDKVTGKGLSTNDYTDAEKTKLAGIATGAEVNVQSDWSQSNTSADDFIKNKPTKTSDFTNDGDGTSNFATEQYVQQNGGKIDTISVNGTQQTITNKNVDIPVPVIDNTLTQTGKAADAKVVGDELADVKNDLGLYQEIPIPYTGVGYYINLSGTTVDLNNPTPSVYGHVYMAVQCAEGDVFIVNAKGGVGPRAWGFINSQNVIISVADASITVENLRLTAPAGSAYLIINDNSDPNKISYKADEPSGNVVRYDINQNKTDAEKARARQNIGIDSASGLSDDIKDALLNCFAHVEWVDEHWQDYYDALEEALYPDVEHWDYEWYASSMELPEGMTADTYNFTSEAGALYAKYPNLNFNYIGNCRIQVEMKTSVVGSLPSLNNPQIVIKNAVVSENAYRGAKLLMNHLQSECLGVGINGVTTDIENISTINDYHVYDIVAQDNVYDVHVDGTQLTLQQNTNTSPYFDFTGIIAGRRTDNYYYSAYFKSIKFKRL